MSQGKLGFGFMRLPVFDGNPENIDFEQLNQMVDEFLGHGFTYFDTSFAYHNGKSEGALKKTVVDRYPRDQFTIATKFPTFAVQTNPLFSGEMNYLANKMLSLGVTDIKKPFPEETVLLDGEDITAQVKEAWDFLVEHAFVM